MARCGSSPWDFSFIFLLFSTIFVTFADGTNNEVVMKKLLCLLLWLCSSLSFAQLENVRVSKIASISQLPVSAICSICQDSEGYMWFGTVNGLCRDDGYSVHVFRSDYLTPGLMDINLVFCISEGRNRQIWFGTQKGLYALDKNTYAIRKVSIPELQDYPVERLLIRANGDIWAACRNYVYELDAAGKLRHRYQLSSPCVMLYEDHQQHLYYASLNGEFYGKAQMAPARLIQSKMPVTGMCEDRKTGGFWLMAGADIWYYNPKATNSQNNPKAASSQACFVKQLIPAALSGSVFRQVAQDPHFHYLWVLTWEHIYVLRNMGNGRLEQVSTEGVFTPEKKTVSNITQTRDGNIWIAAFDQYSSVIDFKGSDIQRFSYQPMLQATGYNPAIVTLCKDEEGWIWYYQETNGLFFYHPTQHVTPVKYTQCPAVSQLPLNVVPYLIKSHQRNCIWALTLPSTVFKLRREGSEMFMEKKLDISAVSKTAGDLEVIFEDALQNLWLGTMNGVFKYDHARNRLICISEKMGDVSCFCQSADGYIWCTVRNKGICRISPQGKWQLYPHEKDFLTLDVTTDGTIWASTGEGQILAFNLGKMDEYKDYTQQAGLNGDMVDHVKVDRFNHLWLVTPQTIREFNPKNGAVRVYSTDDHEIDQYRFLPRAVYRDPQSGDMYFGGIPGMLSFKTGLRLESIPENVVPRITDVKVMGKSIWLDPTREKTQNSIEIEPDEQNLTIEFSTFDFRNHARICYAYRLKGVDEDWVYLPVGKNSAIYNKVAKGDYVFEVKATDENGLWSKHIATFEIHRLPAWWETWWAYTIYLLLALAAIWQMIKRYKQRVEAHNDQIIEENVTASKKEYFDNVQKELNSPLAEINALATKMQEAKTSGNDEQMEKNLGIIQQNVNRLRGMMQEEMDAQLSVTKIDDQFVNKATKIVEDNLGSDQLDVNFLASEMAMSRSTFSRRLKAIRNQTPLEFIRSIKMAHAAAMLRQQLSTVQDVMWAVGYNDHKTFAQVFRDTYGKTPSEYQKENQGK